MKIKIIAFLCVIVSTIAETEQKIKLYALYTPSHAILKNKYFLPSLQDDFEVILKKVGQTCPSSTFMGNGWTSTTIEKVKLIIRAIEENWGSVFVFSDVDIQFFAPVKHLLVSLMGDNDIIMQRNCPEGVLCTGFFMCRGNEKTLRLWKDVKKIMKQNSSQSDQITFNQCIKRNGTKNPYGIKWSYLPNTFFGAGLLTGRLWRPGERLFVPRGIVMHHANWTRGIKNKIAQLQYVQNFMRNLQYINKPFQPLIH